MIIYTDGACSQNGRINSKGGYGVVVCDDNGKLIDAYGHWEVGTTNNIQELKAVLYAMIQYGSKNYNEQCIIFTDSSYVFNIFESWAFSWEQQNWTKSDNKPIKNLKLIKEGYKLYKRLNNCIIKKIRGHSNIFGNELADAIATKNQSKINALLIKNKEGF